MTTITKNRKLNTIPRILYVVLFFNIGVIIVLMAAIVNYKNRLASSEQQTMAVLNKLNQSDSFWILEHSNNDHTIHFDGMLFSSSGNLSLKELVSDGSTIILRYFSNSCLPCYEDIIKIFQESSSRFGSTRCIILSSHTEGNLSYLDTRNYIRTVLFLQ